jgi:CubicO group peptidase (beta-lactamase class C family)
MLNLYALERQIQERMALGQVPGLALAIVHNLEVTYARGFGLTSVEDGGLPVTADTLFRAGSLTKALTSLAVMRLVESEALNLDRPVAAYVPGLQFSDEGAAERITLRMLLSHTAGLPTSHTPFGRRGPGGLAQYVHTDVPNYPFVAPPGKLYAYSNPGVRIAGYIAQTVAKQPYLQLMQDLVFDPLDMGRTTFDPTVAMTYPVAQSHDLCDDGSLRVQHRFADDSGGYPSGGVITTALDLTHLALMHLDGGRYRGRQILAPASLSEMQAVQADRYTVAGGRYGLGLSIDIYKGLRRLAHDGSISTFGSKLAMIPEAGAAVILLFNRAPGFWAQAQEIVDGILDQLLELPPGTTIPQPVEPDRSLWPGYTGAYLGDWRGLALVEAVADGLTLNWNGQAMRLQALRDDLYFGQRAGSTDLASVGFVPEGKSAAQYVQINSSPCRRLAHEVPTIAPGAACRAYPGTYSGVETLIVHLEEDGLSVYAEDTGQEMPCVPLSDTLFACDVGLLEFLIDERGAVDSLRFGRTYTLHRQGAPARIEW